MRDELIRERVSGRDAAGGDPSRSPEIATTARSLDELLTRRRLLSTEALARARLVQQETGEPLESVVTRLGLIAEATLARALADAANLPFVGADGFPAELVGGQPLSLAFLHDVHALPIALSPDHVTVALANPFNAFAVEALGFVFARRVRGVVALASDIDAAIERLYRGAGEDGDDLAETADEDDLERLKDLVSDAPVIRAVNRLIAEAVDAQASDIHVEPADDRLAVRLRIDGVLRDRPPLPPAMRTAFVSRVKVMAGLNIAERRLPQDGRLRLAVRGQEIDLRIATSPSIHGESVVMRILDRSNLALDFGALGFDEALSEQFRRALHRPHGIVLITGPTGSGKTTTLYAALAELNSGSRKLLTIEDPIEYRLPGVVQAQVNPAIGFTFSSALRSFLRQDPDVMMVGEIRDGETAQIAVQAALTGHVILATLHTNTAPGAITRLLDMGIEPFLLGSVVNAVMAQRLVRRLCAHCREEYLPGPEVHGLMPGLELGDRPLYRPRGCAKCGGNGYQGRIALIELLVVDDRIAHLVLQGAGTRDIAAAAAEAKMRTLLGDGLAKAHAGLTTLAEVLRVATEV